MLKETIDQMVLIGEIFATYRMSIGDEIMIVKMEDYPVPGRENSRSYREYLAFRLATQIGLSVPFTSLRQDPHYGRLSVQQYVHGATKPTKSLLEQMASSSLGMRIALFDILCGNHDRKPDNLLQFGTEIIPIDFNTTFQITTTSWDFDQETEIILARWFQVRGILSLKPGHRSLLLEEARRMVEHLDDSFLNSCLAEIPAPFCDSAEIEKVWNFLVSRRDLLYASVSTWWDKNVAPLHLFDEDALMIAIREHTR